jgi:hypothetical protein
MPMKTVSRRIGQDWRFAGSILAEKSQEIRRACRLRSRRSQDVRRPRAFQEHSGHPPVPAGPGRSIAWIAYRSIADGSADSWRRSC